MVNLKIAILQHDNTQLNVARITLEKLKQFCWEIFSHPPYFPGVEPSDYFISFVSKFSQRKKNYKKKGCEKQYLYYYYYFQLKLELYKRWINYLPKRWTEVSEKDGLFIIR